MACTYHEPHHRHRMLHDRLLQQEATHLMHPPTPLPVSNTAIKILRITVLILIAANFLFLVYYFICLCTRRSNRPPETPVRHCTSDNCNSLADIPVVVIQPSQPAASLSCYASDCCFICLGNFSDGNETRVLPECKHIFHKECIDLWLSASTSCPVCRAHVIEPVVPPAGPSCRLERSQMFYPLHFPSSLI